MAQRTAEHRLFSQSRLLNLRNWQCVEQHSRARQGKQTDIRSAPDEASDALPDIPLSFPYYHDDEALIIAFNRVHFHQQIYDALSSNPLSTLYSLAWSLCLHIEAQPSDPKTSWLDDRAAPYPDDADYIRVWFPFILLHRMAEQLTRLLNHLADKKQPPPSVNEAQALFTFADLRAADRRFRAAFYSVLDASDHPNHETDQGRDNEIKAARKQRFNADIEAYLQSPLFQRQCQRTPYGLSDVQASENKGDESAPYQLRFIHQASAMSDKKKFLYNFKRYQAYEPLRAQIEKQLRARFPRYHNKHGIFIESWLFGSISTNEATESAQSGQRAYVLFWQLHMSSLLWLLIHTLFALDATLNHVMLDDLLWFIAHGVERFIQCGLCHAHWTAPGGGQAQWQQHETHFLANRTKAFIPPALPSGVSFDQMMLMTHNAIQIEKIDPSKGLTQAALNALRQDYAHFAAAFIGCLVADSDSSHWRPPLIDDGKRVPFRCSIYDLESARRDLCRIPLQLYHDTLLQDQQQISQMANDEHTVMTCMLTLERKHGGHLH